jgi:hypothetical protein
MTNGMIQLLRKVVEGRTGWLPLAPHGHLTRVRAPLPAVCRRWAPASRFTSSVASFMPMRIPCARLAEPRSRWSTFTDPVTALRC